MQLLFDMQITSLQVLHLGDRNLKFSYDAGEFITRHQLLMPTKT